MPSPEQTPPQCTPQPSRSQPEPHPRVQVLLATFNGERFLREQIDSILAQTLPGVTLLARDDGSSDTTPAILAEYATRFPERLRILPTGAPAGSAQSNFRALLRASKAPYIALADQDDVWLPNKLELELEAMRSLEQRHGAEIPLLVFSDLEVVDEHLSPIARSFWKLRRLNPANIHRPGRLLMENVLTGCTALLNAPLVQRASSMPDTACMHDGWIALLACLLGDACFLLRPLVLYRQHSSNVIGAVSSASSLGLRGRMGNDRTANRWRASVLQARDLLRIHGPELPPDSRDVVEALLHCDASPSRWERLGIMLQNGFFIGRLRSNLATAWYLLGRKPPKSAGRPAR